MPSNRRALCVGINQFKNYPSATLQGCVPDANNMSSLLQKLLGFTSSDITLLTDAQATKTNIINNLKMMVDGARAGKYSYLVFSMSSHGTQVPDLEGDEADHADEAFCPTDLAQAGNQWDRNHIIVDDELRNIFLPLPSNVLLEVYLDTCHCGTGLKGIDMLLDRKPRFLPPPSLEAFRQVETLRPRTIAERFVEKGIVHHILWAACRADQTSADANINGSWHGAFTYYFCKVMLETNNSLSRAEALKRVRKYLAAGHYTQIPQLETEATNRQLKGVPEMMEAALAR
ncbi:MAG TPA: caspase family protein [Bryobacteraceae bacterium]|nr:caspase family protein [Bryobacteraceae bacterium]